MKPEEKKYLKIKAENGLMKMIAENYYKEKKGQ